MRTLATCAAVAWLSWIAPASAEVLVSEGSAMRYLANSSLPFVPTWTSPGFDDGGWSVGTHGVGYGAGGLVSTLVPAGTRSVYTRAEFTVTDVAAIETVLLSADWDDGYAAWLNGVELYRSPEMPAGFLTWNSPVGSHESSNGPDPNYGTPIDVTAAALAALHDGVNVLAVGVWNATSTSSDLVVVPRLETNPGVTVVRGPYLQLATETSIVVRWRTSVSTPSRVRVGTDPAALDAEWLEPAPTVDHEITVDGLEPDTVYHYAIGMPGLDLAGGDGEHWFRTLSPVGTRRPLRFWVIGDSGTANANARAVRDAFETYVGSSVIDAWLMLGDNAYNTGTESEYQAAVFDTYPARLRRTAVWPTLGNHDGYSADSGTQTGPYFEVFTLPSGGEAGGAISGTEAYYSFEVGNVHFVCLDSYGSSRATGGPMLTWLEADLASTAQDWVVAFWHHPPYSKGSHDSDTEIELIEMRQNALPILEAWGVDLVLGGHSHSYERSMLLDGHYGTSSTLSAASRVDDGDGRIDGDGPYRKASGGAAGHEGAVYVVAGSSGKISGGSLDHPVMLVSWNELGSMVLDVEGDRLGAVFVDDTGAELDQFTIVKRTDTAPLADFVATPATGPAPLAVAFDDSSSTNATAWSWDLDGDGAVDSTEREPSFTYASPGLYDVSLTVTNDAGGDLSVRPGAVCVGGIVPDPITDLAVGGDRVALSWSPVDGVADHQVASGDLHELRAAGELATAATGCVATGSSDPATTDAVVPGPGAARWLLVRAVAACGEAGSWGDAERDTALGAAVCP